MYLNTQTMMQHSEQDIRAAYPNTSFPVPFVAPDEYALVFPAPQPGYDHVTQSVREVAPVLTDKSHYEQQWEVVELYATQEERDAAIAADIEAKRKAAVPASVSPRQIRQALTQAGMRQLIEQSIAGGDQNAKDWYEYATAFERNNPLVLGMAQALSITERQLDDLWTLAGSL